MPLSIAFILIFWILIVILGASANKLGNPFFQKRKKTPDHQAINQREAQKKEIAEKIKQENTILPSNPQDTETVKQVKKLLGLEEEC